MLRLVCGAAAGLIRQALVRDLLDTHGASGTLLVVPDESWAENLSATLSVAAGGLERQVVFALPQLLDCLRVHQVPLVVEPRERLVVLRSILQQRPHAFDRLVGEGSAPHLTQGVLQRIADSTARIMEQQALAEEGDGEAAPSSARMRQLLELGREYQARLEAAGALDRRVADRAACLQITPERFAVLLPGVEQVIFVGFDTWDDGTLLALRRLRDAAPNVFVLLQFDPLEDSQRYLHLAEVYPRVYDLADDVITDAPDAAGGPQPQPASIRVVRTRSRRQEARSIARYLRARLEQDAQTPRGAVYGDYLVCVSTMDKYFPLLEAAFTDYGIPLATRPRVRVFDHPLAQLLEALRAALSTGRSFPAVRQLLKSPFLGALLGDTHGNPPETVHGRTLPMLHVLDRLRRNGHVGGDGKDLLREVRNHLARLNTQLQTAEHDELEAPRPARLSKDPADVAMLAAVLERLFDLLKTLEADSSLEEWSARLVALMRSARQALAAEGEELGVFHTVAGQLQVAAQRLAACAPLLGEQAVGFVSLVGMLRVALGNACVEDAPQSLREGIQIVDRWQGRGRRPAVVVLCGMVDGEFPQYSQREATLEEEGAARPNQQTNLSRQRYLFDQYLNSAREEVLLLVPEAEDGAELLESQFVEELLAEGDRTVETQHADDFCALHTPAVLSAEEAAKGLSRCLQVQLDTAKRKPAHASAPMTPSVMPPLLRNIVWNVAANYERTRPDALGNFDGYVQDANLLAYLRHRLAHHVHSVSQLDVLVQCPFRYFTEYVLKLEELEELEDGIDPRDLGKLAHDILFRFMTKWVERGHGTIDAATRSEALALLFRHADAALEEQKLTEFSRDLLRFKLFGTANEGATTGGGNAPRLREFPGLLTAFADLEVTRTENSGGNLMTPAYFEMGFGLKTSRYRDERDEHSIADPVELDLGGERVRLRGRADRVDVGPDSFAIVDYKTGAAPSIKDQTEGYRVQIPAYLMALEQIFRARGEHLTPAGGVFFALGADSAEMTGQFFRKDFHAQGGLPPRVRTMDEDAFLAAMDLVRLRIADGLQRVREGRFHVTLAGEKVACNYCASAGICRKDLPRAERLVPLVSVEQTAGAGA